MNPPLCSLTLMVSILFLTKSSAGDPDRALLEEMTVLSRRVTNMQLTLDTLRENLEEKDKDLTDTKEKIERLEKEISDMTTKNAQLEDPPFAFICGYQSNFIQENANIFYSKLLYNRENTS